MPKAFLVPTRAHRPVLMDRPALVDASGQLLKLSDSKSEELQLGQSFASVRQITESCTAICNTQFTPPKSKPDWFDGLNAKLDVLKGYANVWLDNYAIAVTSTIPASVITFVPVFESSASVLMGIIDRNRGALSPSDTTLARDALARMATKVSKITQQVEFYAKVDEKMVTSGKLVTWQQNMRAARKELETGSTNIQSAYSSLTQEITEYNSKIDALKADIREYNKLVSLGGGLVGGGVFLGIIGASLCYSFPPVGGILLALGVGMVIGGSATWGVMQSKINKAHRDIVDFTRQIGEDKQSIAALQSLSAAASTTLSSADSAINNLTDFAATWATFGHSLRATLAALDAGGTEAYGSLLEMDLKEAVGNWNDAKDYAKRLSGVSSEVKVLPSNQAVA